MNRQAFTLMEVVVSIVLLALIGVALMKLSSANIEGTTYANDSRLDLSSLVVYSRDDLATIDDYSQLKDIDMPELSVDRGSDEDVFTYEYQLDYNLTLELDLYFQNIQVGEEGVRYYRFK
ncbi:MAG: prepilin-type N-terminal cleavage/methylation domain-containing protein [Campylobacterales bacterium]